MDTPFREQMYPIYPINYTGKTLIKINESVREFGKNKLSHKICPIIPFRQVNSTHDKGDILDAHFQYLCRLWRRCRRIMLTQKYADT